MPQPINILVTGAGAPGAPGILHCLQQDPQLHLTAADINPGAAGRWIAHAFETIPPGDQPEFIPALLALCKRKSIRVVLPLVTRELLPLAHAKQQFEEAGIAVQVSAAASLEIANDKSRLYQFLQWRGIAVPDFRVVETAEQFQQAVTELGYPELPVCFKPSVSNGSRGFRILDAQIREADLLFKQKPGHCFASYGDVLRILSAEPFPELLVSEYLPGEEYSVDCLANQGETLLAVPRLRKKMLQGISVEGEMVNAEGLIRYCSTIIAALQLHGNIGIQVKKGRSGEYDILEINPRLQGTVSAALGAGVNFPLLAVRQALGLPFQFSKEEIRWGTRFTRVWREIFH